MSGDRRDLFLAAGLQSGGTTLVSWCFLQRADMDGVLDLPFDQLLDVPAVESPMSWCKMTVASFRWQDVADHYAILGYRVHPLLIIRDVRHAYSSLKGKEYGRNSTTAEDPPLRLRLLRFLRDWQQFRENEWPILRFESLLSDPQQTLQACCNDLGLPWDVGMLEWPKMPADLIDATRGNETFWGSGAGGGLEDAIARAPIRDLKLTRAELAWLEDAFAEYNRVNGYAPHIEALEHGGEGFTPPRFESSSRQQLFAEILDLRNQVDETLLCRGRLLANLINAFPYPRKTLRALRCRWRRARERRNASVGEG